MIYLNNAATTVLKPEPVKNAQEASPEEAKKKIKKLLGCKGDVVLTNGGSEALETAIAAFVKPGDHVISTDMEYGTVLNSLDALVAKGCTVTYIPINEYGVIKYDLIEDAVTPETVAIVCNHGSNVTGNIVDLDKIGTIARRHHLKMIVDGCQTVGATDINLEDLQVDVFCFTAHKKLMGPYGVGAICLRQGISIDDETIANIEELSPQKLGTLCAAIDFVMEKGIYGVSVYPHRLAKRFFESVKSMTAVKIYGDFGTNTRIPTVAMTIDGFSPAEIKEFMRKKGITIKSGDFNASRLMESFGTKEDGMVRFSFGYFNTRMDVNDTIWTLMELQGLDDLYYLA